MRNIVTMAKNSICPHLYRTSHCEEFIGGENGQQSLKPKTPHVLTCTGLPIVEEFIAGENGQQSLKPKTPHVLTCTGLPIVEELIAGKNVQQCLKHRTPRVLK
jgi:hypothetical protein